MPVVSAPGKSILLGDHAAVYGRPALVAAVDRRLTVTALPRADGAIHLRLGRSEVRRSWKEAFAYAAGLRTAWERYRYDPRPETFARLRGGDPAHVVVLALAEAALRQGDEPASAPGLDLHVVSTVPIGSGFGSSAAAGVAVAGAYFALRGRELPPRDLLAVAQEVERRQHGLPSGVDAATVVHGGVVWAHRDAAGELTLDPLPTSPLLDRLRVLHSGPAGEPTGTVVAAVRARREAAPAAVDAIFDRMESAARAFRDLVAAGDDDAEAPVALIREAQAGLEALGVVPAPVEAVVRRIEGEGGAAKVSGAGSLAGPGAGSLLVYHPEPDRIASWPFLAGFELLDVRLGAEGVRREDS